MIKTIRNSKLSERQSFRLSILENITLGMVLIPYITLNIAGELHVISFVLGLVFCGIYFLFIGVVRRYYSEGFLERINSKNFVFGKLISAIYSVRYLLRASLIILFFSQVAREFMISTYKVVWIIIPFFIVCIYGACGGIERRGRISEILFVWMIVPLILAAAFSIGGIDFFEMFQRKNIENSITKNSIFEVLAGGYFVLLILSNSELILVNDGIKNEGTNKVLYRIFLWQIITLCFSYFCVIGVLGEGFTKSKSIAGLNVMEAAEFPGKIIERLDYPIMAFWIIGVFVLAGSYLFWARTCIKKLCRRNVSLPVILVVCSVFIFGWYSKKSNWILALYLFYADFILGVLIPTGYAIFDYAGNKKKHPAKKKCVFKIATAAGVLLLISFAPYRSDYSKKIDLVDVSNLNKNEKKSSVETRDYCLDMTVRFQGENTIFQFNISDPSNYSEGETNGTGDEYKIASNSLKKALDYYCNSNGRRIDLGHLKLLTIVDDSGDKESGKYYDFIKEISQMQQIPKSAEVIYDNGTTKKQNILRKLIKIQYNGEVL